jgi:dihydrofolate synthase/folylpolyglutamate synthase
LRTLKDWLDWAGTLHPSRMELGLGRVGEVWARMGGGGLGCPAILVGGTNGKGSCVAMIESMAAAAGYRVACYTSPHLLRYNERVRIAGREAEDGALCGAFERVESARGTTQLTYFELGTLAAFDLIRTAAPDLAVLEVGLGGQLDAVNLIDGDAALVASIGRDHVQWLGETPEEIALEKAGIFRPHRVAVIGDPGAPPVLREAAERLGARPLQVGRELRVEPDPAGGGWTWGGPEGERLAMPAPALRGAVQLHNAAAAIAALRALKDRLPVPASALRAGLLRARPPGRFQVVPGRPSWILDVAHNREAAQALAQSLVAYGCRGRVRAVLAVLADKEPELIALPLVPLVERWYLSRGDDPRAMPAETLALRLRGTLAGAESLVFGELDRALERAQADSAPDDSIVVYGSFVTVAQALARVGAGDLAGILPG